MSAQIPDFLLLMYGLTHEQRLEAYRQFNSWQWPDCLSGVKPEGYDKLRRYNPKDRNDPNTMTAHPFHEPLRDALYIVTNEWQRSWNHNARPSPFHVDGMTAHEHRQWWKEKYGQ